MAKPDLKAMAFRMTGQAKPIVIGGFILNETGIKVTGRPSFAEYEGVGEFIRRVHHASGFWLGDWLRYGEGREDWRERLSQAHDATGLTEKTLKNVRAVAGSVRQEQRRADVAFGLHAEVVALPADEQEHWLERAADERWDARDLRMAIRSSKRRKVLEGQATLEGMFRVVYADPPWEYGNRPPSGTGAVEHYPTMSIEQLCKLPVAAHAMPNSVLFMWVTAPIVLQNPGPREVGEAWGFAYKQQFVWDKVEGTFGHYTGGNHEILTIWTRGSCLPDVPLDLPDSVQVINKSRLHSEKPAEFRDLIQRHWTIGPYLELFARERVPGWSCFGNDAALWAQEAATV